MSNTIPENARVLQARSETTVWLSPDTTEVSICQEHPDNDDIIALPVEDIPQLISWLQEIAMEAGVKL